MKVADLFSKRMQEARGELPDVYVYDRIPSELKEQIIYLYRDVFVPSNGSLTGEGLKVLSELHDLLAREYGLAGLPNCPSHKGLFVEPYLRQLGNVERILDLVEVLFGLAMPLIGSELREHHFNGSFDPDSVLAELSYRFRRAGVGYRLEGGKIVRVDSEHLHSEAVQPVLELLQKSVFHTVNDEYRAAHSYYREGDYEAVLTEANKSFETMLKVICEKKGWIYDKNGTASKLISTVIDNGLLPKFYSQQLNDVMKSGIPTVRNKDGAHGQGAEKREVPQYVAEYVLHLTATTLLMLGKAANF